MSEVMYRARSGVFDEGGSIRIIIEQHNVLKKTPRGKWVSMPYPKKKRFVLDDGVKRFAHETKEGALHALGKRKQIQISWLKYYMRVAETTIRLVKDGHLDSEEYYGEEELPPKSVITAGDSKLLRSLLPDWARASKEGLDPTMYGTGTYKGDCEIIERVKSILVKEE